MQAWTQQPGHDLARLMNNESTIRMERANLPAALVKTGSQLLHAQCWAWGQDIKRGAGNLLLQYGFDRDRPPAGVSGCSQYTLVLPLGLILRIWGFGIYIGEDEGIYLNRFEFVPRRAILEDAWSPAQLSRGRRHVCLPLLLRLADWLSEYEQWVETVAGRSYRQAVFSDWENNRGEAIDLSVDWMAMRCELDRLLKATRQDRLTSSEK